MAPGATGNGRVAPPSDGREPNVPRTDFEVRMTWRACLEMLKPLLPTPPIVPVALWSPGLNNMTILQKFH